MNEHGNKTMQWSHVSPYCLVRTLLRNAWTILVAALVFSLAASLFLDWFYVPEYKASMTYAVNSKTTSYISAGNLTSTREVAAVLSDLLETDVMKEGIENYDPRLKDFQGTITATQLGESNFIQIDAVAATPEQAFLALDAVQVVFPEVAGFISGRSVLYVMRNPSVSPYPSNMVDSAGVSRTAAICGAVLMAVLLCYFSIQSETIQTRTGARHLLDAPILASICHEQKNRTLKTILQRTNRQVQVFSPTTSFAYSEQISAVCSQLEHENQARDRKVFLVTGVGESEGKSTVAANVASALALKGHNVALVDCDLRKPAMNRFFGGVYSSEMPLNRMLGRPYSRENLLQCMVRNEQLGLYMLFPQGSDSRSTELVSGETMDQLIRQLRVFDYVIIDSPPMGMFPDAEVLADKSDASLMVVRQDYTAACDVNDAIDSLRQYHASFLGVVLNDMLVGPNGQYGYGTKYGRGSRYSYAGKYSYNSRSSEQKDKATRTKGKEK